MRAKTILDSLIGEMAVRIVSRVNNETWKVKSHLATSVSSELLISKSHPRDNGRGLCHGSVNRKNRRAISVPHQSYLSGHEVN
jgi:hypothetical protein